MQKPYKDMAKFTSKFGMRFHPIHKVPKMHNGIDLVITNDEVLAVDDGIVDYAGRDTSNIGIGNWVRIVHDNGYISYYYHLKEVKVERGQIVTAGVLVGIQGSTGAVTGKHLHFGLKHKDTWIDPAPLIGLMCSVGDYDENAADKPGWEVELGTRAIESLHRKGLLNNPEDWKGRLLEETPMYLLWIMLERMAK